MKTLDSCFETFDPSKRKKDSPPEEAFVKYFKNAFKNDCSDAFRASRSRQRLTSVGEYARDRATIQAMVASEEAFERWMWRLYRQALGRVDHETHRFIRLHVIEGWTFEETGRLMKVSPRTLRRRFRTKSLARRIRGEIQSMVRELPRRNLQAIVHRMFIEDGLGEEQVSSLLLLPLPHIVEVIRDMPSGPVGLRVAISA
jgi:RNA polymerase sigma factor (sigma-70 family)